MLFFAIAVQILASEGFTPHRLMVARQVRFRFLEALVGIAWFLFAQIPWYRSAWDDVASLIPGISRAGGAVS